MSQTNAINSVYNKRLEIKKDIKRYEQKLYVDQCIDAFSATRHKKKTKEISYRTQVKEKNNPFPLSKIIIAAVIIFSCLIASVLLKNFIFLQEQKYQNMVEKTEEIVMDNKSLENELLSKTSSSYYLQRVDELGMQKNKKVIYIDSNKVKEERQ